MKKLPTIITAACLAAFFAGCGDSNKADADAKADKKNPAKAAAIPGASVKLTGNAVTDYKATLAKIQDMAPRWRELEKSNRKIPSPAQIKDAQAWATLQLQLHEVLKNAKPAEREQIDKYNEELFEKHGDDEDKKWLLSIIMTSQFIISEQE